ncbi:MAG: hypothetical protein VW268_07530 [Rhodospirillaceae bacterium]
MFRIQNLGEKWLKPAELKITGPSSGRILKRRTVRMAEDQATTLKVSNAARYGEALEFEVDAKWGRTTKDAQARAACK